MREGGGVKGKRGGIKRSGKGVRGKGEGVRGNWREVKGNKNVVIGCPENLELKITSIETGHCCCLPSALYPPD